MHEELLAAPTDEALWERFGDLPAERREAAADALKEALDREVRTDPSRALELADVLFRACELTPGRRALGYRGRAVARHVSERLDEALADYHEALARYDEAGEELEVARLERALLDLHAMAGRTTEALACADRARGVFERLGERRHLAQLLVNLGNMHFHREDLAPAGAAYGEAAAIFEDLGDELGLGIARFSQANLEVLAGRYDEADAAYAAARVVFDTLGMAPHVAECDYGRAWTLSRRCRFAPAIEALEAARSAFLDGGKPSRAPLCDLDLADLYLRLDARWDAIERASAAVEAFEALELEPDLAKALVVRGLARSRSGSAEAAAADLARADTLLEAQGNRGASLALRLERAALARDASAVDELTAIDAQLAGGANALLADSARILLARAHTATGRPGAARAAVAPWCDGERERRASDLLLEVEALRAGAEAERCLGQVADAQRLLERAVERIDRTYATVPGSDARLAFFRDRHGAFGQLAWLRATDGDAAGAIEALELGRSRDLLARTDDRPSRRVVDDRAERERLDGLLLRRLDADLGALSGHGAPPGEGALAGPADDELLEAERALLRRHRDAAEAGVVELPGASDLTAALAPDELAVAFLADGEDLGVLLADQAGWTWTPLELGVAQVAALTQRLELALAKRLAGPRSARHEARSRATLDGLLATLGRGLVGPWSDRLASPRRLVVAPYGVLHGLPLQALIVEGEPLVRRHVLAYTPALSLVARLRRRPASPPGSLVAATSRDARLPELIREQTALAALAGGGFEEVEPAALEGRLASGERAVAALHLAAHGSFQPSNPVFSGLSLGERVLTSGEGGIFPRGIVVGAVVRRGGDQRVIFSMNRAPGGFVRLMPSMKIPRPEDFPVEEPADETETAASDETESGASNPGAP